MADKKEPEKARIVSIEDWEEEGIQDCLDCPESESTICGTCKGPEYLPEALKQKDQDIHDVVYRLSEYPVPFKEDGTPDCLQCPTERKLAMCETRFHKASMPGREVILISDKLGLLRMEVCAYMDNEGMCTIHDQKRPELCEDYFCE